MRRIYLCNIQDTLLAFLAISHYPMSMDYVGKHLQDTGVFIPRFAQPCFFNSIPCPTWRLASLRSANFSLKLSSRAWAASLEALSCSWAGPSSAVPLDIHIWSQWSHMHTCVCRCRCVCLCVQIYIYNVNPGLTNHGLLIRVVLLQY